MKRTHQIVGACGIFASSCVSGTHADEAGPSPRPQTKQAQAVDLLRAIYDPTKTETRVTITKSCYPTRSLQSRLDQIRAEDRDVHVTIRVLNPSGAEISQRFGTYVQGKGQFVASAKEHESSTSSATVSIQFLDWGNDRLIIGFTELNSQPLASENFEYHPSTRTWDLFESGPYIIN